MQKTLRRNYIVALLIAIAFALYGATPVLAQASTNTSPSANWAWTDGNQFNQNYNPQTTINTNNAASLQISWIFPVPGTPAEWASSAIGLPDIGVGLAGTPIVYNGIIYTLTQYNEIFALNAGSGNVLWSTTLPYGPNATSSLGIAILQHYHNSAMALSTNSLLNGTTLWISSTSFKVYALDALTGAIKLSFPFLTGNATDHYNVPGNEGTYSGISPALLLDQRRGIIITSASGTSSANSGRGFFRGWNVTVSPPALLWTTYTSAPQDGSNPSWDIQNVANMTGAWIFNGTGAVNLKTLPASTLNATLYNDWGYKESAACSAGLGGKSSGGVGQSWGGPWVLDPNSGIAYVATNNRNPYDSPCTPGPDLWSASILALNDQTGKLIWGFQTNAHDSWDWDCSWNQVLANETISGQTHEVVIKSCKDAYIYELDAQTGQLYWYFTPPQSDLPRCQYCQLLNPLNRTQMTSAFPTPNNVPFVSSPGFGGGFENDFSYDPAINMIVAVNHNVPNKVAYAAPNATNYQTNNGAVILGGVSLTDNATVYGVNAATGKEMWHYFIPDIGYRGGVTTSGGVAYLTLSTGFLVMLNAQTGAVVGQKLIGGPLNNLPAIATTASGQEEMILPIASGIVTFASVSPPGDIVALTLPAASNSTATGSATTTTATTTAVSTTTLSGGLSTTTVSGSATTVTVATGSSTGISSAELYGVAAIAAIFIIATGILATRRGGSRKPAS